MENSKKEKKVVLFPRSIDYYQVQLTKMLENEQYEEAVELLTFLMSSEINDEYVYEEWSALLGWLKDQFIHIGDEDIDEVDLLDQHVKAKWANDTQFAHHLVDVLRQERSLDSQLLALEQLAFIPDVQVTEKIIRWLEQEERHPLLQFKALQTLRKLGVDQRLHLWRFGEEVSLVPTDTPLKLEDFPIEIQDVLALVREKSEIYQPNLLYFAEHTWYDFLSFVYGSIYYRQLLKFSQENKYACAAALHSTSLEAMSGDPAIAEIAKMYGVPHNDASWEWMGKLLNQFIQKA